MDPEPRSPEELAAFSLLQAKLGPMFARLLPDPRLQRTVIVVPSLSMDPELIASVQGVRHYEERLLCMLLLLRLPRTRIIYLTSTMVDPVIVDYYLHLLPGVPHGHARQRLEMISCHDASPASLTDKILARPRLLRRIAEHIVDPELAHMTCFHATDRERTLSVQLGIPIYACDPALSKRGTKSGSRRIFREAGVTMPAGFESLRDVQDAAQALAALKADDPSLGRAVVKLEEGASGGARVRPSRAAPSRRTPPIALRSRRTGDGLASSWSISGPWDASGSTSSRCPNVGAGGTTPSRSTCARAAPPTPTASCKCSLRANTTAGRAGSAHARATPAATEPATI